MKRWGIGVFDMASLDPLLQTLIIASPIAVVVTLIVLLVIARRGRRQKLTAPAMVFDALALTTLEDARATRATPIVSDAPAVIQKSGSGIPVPTDLTDRAGSADQTLPLGRPLPLERTGQSSPQKTIDVPSPVEMRAFAPPTATAPTSIIAPSAAVSAGSSPVDVASLRRRLEIAEASANMIEVAPLHLAIADAYGQQGNGDARMSALRSAAGIAAKHGPLAVHARARLEMADAAYQSGDLTGACEQWQLARTALLADGQTAEHARVEKTMRDHQCPTDWVLTDF